MQKSFLIFYYQVGSEDHVGCCLAAWKASTLPSVPSVFENLLPLPIHGPITSFSPPLLTKAFNDHKLEIGYYLVRHWELIFYFFNLYLYALV